MATPPFRSATQRATPLPKSSTSGDDGESSSSAGMSASRRHRSLSRFSHRRMPDLNDEVKPARKGKFVSTSRGSEFPEISLDDLAVEFFDSFSADSSGISGGERGRSGSRKSGGGGDGEPTVSQRRGRSVSRASLGGGGVVQRLTADTESSRRRRSVSRAPARDDAGDSGGGLGSANSVRRRSVSRAPARGDAGDSGGGIGSRNSVRRRSVSRPPSRGEAGETGGGIGRANSVRRRSVSRPPARGDADPVGGVGRSKSVRRRSVSRPPARGDAGDRGGGVGSANSVRRRSVSRQPARGNAGDYSGGAGNANSRRRRSLSVVRCRISDSESDADHFQSSSNRGYSKNYTSGNGQITGSLNPAASGHRRSFSQNEFKYHDGYSSHSSAITDDEGKDKYSGKHRNERIIRAVYTQNKATTKTRKSLGDDPQHPIISITKDYATKLQESEERKRDLLAEILLEEERGKELSKIVKELLTESSPDVSQKPSRPRKRSKDGSRMSTCLTDEAEKYIEEFISNIEDTDFESLDDERSETSSFFSTIKTDTSQTTGATKSASVETDGVALPWLQWETSTDSSQLPYLSKSLHTPLTKSKIWDSDSAQDAISGHEMSIRSVSSRGSCSAAKSSHPCIHRVGQESSTRLKIDVADYLKRPSNVGFLYESWKLRHRIDSGSLVLCSRFLI